MQRNDKCFCGIGKKYKNCHLKLESVHSDGNAGKEKLSRDQQLQQAIENFGSMPRTKKGHQITRAVSSAKGNSLQANTRAAQKIGGGE